MNALAETTAVLPSMPQPQSNPFDEEEVFEYEQPDGYLSASPLDRQIEQIHTVGG